MWCILSIVKGLLVGSLESVAQAMLKGLPMGGELAILKSIRMGGWIQLPVFCHQVLPGLIGQVRWSVIPWSWFEAPRRSRGGLDLQSVFEELMIGKFAVAQVRLGLLVALNAPVNAAVTIPSGRKRLWEMVLLRFKAVLGGIDVCLGWVVNGSL